MPFTLVIKINGRTILSKPGMTQGMARAWKDRFLSFIPHGIPDQYEVEMAEEIECLPLPQETARLLMSQQDELHRRERQTIKAAEGLGCGPSTQPLASSRVN